MPVECRKYATGRSGKHNHRPSGSKLFKKTNKIAWKEWADKFDAQISLK